MQPKEYRGTLPGKVWELVESSKALMALKQTAEHIAEGRPTGILQCTSALRRAHVATDEVKNAEMFQQNFDIVKKEWALNVQEALGRVDEISAAEAFLMKHSMVIEAARAWEFDNAEVKWLKIATPDPVMTEEVKRMETFVNSFATNLRVFEDLCGQVGDLEWLAGDLSKHITDAKTVFSAFEPRFKHLQELLATLVLTNALLTGCNVEATKVYINSKLKVQLSSLAPALRERLSTMKKADAASASSSSAASTRAPTDHNGDKDSFKEPSKKMRRLKK